MTTTFTYTVTIEVNDEQTECYNTDLFDQTDGVEDENGEIVARFLSPETMADIVIGQRLDIDEDYEFYYSIDYKKGVSPEN